MSAWAPIPAPLWFGLWSGVVGLLELGLLYTLAPNLQEQLGSVAIGLLALGALSLSATAGVLGTAAALSSSRRSRLRLRLTPRRLTATAGRQTWSMPLSDLEEANIVGSSLILAAHDGDTMYVPIPGPTKRNQQALQTFVQRHLFPPEPEPEEPEPLPEAALSVIPPPDLGALLDPSDEQPDAQDDPPDEEGDEVMGTYTPPLGAEPADEAPTEVPTPAPEDPQVLPARTTSWEGAPEDLPPSPQLATSSPATERVSTPPTPADDAPPPPDPFAAAPATDHAPPADDAAPEDEAASEDEADASAEQDTPAEDAEADAVEASAVEAGAVEGDDRAAGESGTDDDEDEPMDVFDHPPLH